MYQSHWGLRETPFRTSLDPRFFFESPTYEEALARLHFLVDEHRRVGLLLGDPGSGKSLVLEVFADEIRREGRAVARLNLVGLSAPEMLWQLAASLGLNLDPAGPLVSLWRAVADRLAEHRYQETATAVLLDDADQAGADVLAQVARLARLDPTPEARLTIVLAAHRADAARLGRPLLELAELRIDLEPWDPADTEQYLSDTLARAGCPQPAFDPPAVRRIHELAQGVPRRVNQLADLALLAGAGRALDRVDADTVESVYRELGAIEL